MSEINASERLNAATAAARLLANLNRARAEMRSALENGIPARAAQPARTMPNGQTIPPIPAAPAISAEALRDVFGEELVDVIAAATAE